MHWVCQIRPWVFCILLGQITLTQCLKCYPSLIADQAELKLIIISLAHKQKSCVKSNVVMHAEEKHALENQKTWRHKERRRHVKIFMDSAVLDKTRLWRVRSEPASLRLLIQYGSAHLRSHETTTLSFCFFFSLFLR